MTVLLRGVCVALVLAAVIAVAGCGESEQPRTRGPADATFTVPEQETVAKEPAPTCRRAPRVKRSKRGRDVRVAGLDSKPKRRPRKLEVAREISLSCLVWSSFGGGSAEASGRAEVLDCVPSCAQSDTARREARLRVTKLRRCRGRRFYSKASLLLGRGEDAERAPIVVTVPCGTGSGRS